ncbi:MAG: phosphoglucosamine mutase [Thermodesulfobacteriota bacterium]|nr:phosphoglucosamine mutase [Thermodesulfobacteriota bacterium]
MGRLFGTDGIRGIANHYPMTAEMAMKTGMAVGRLMCCGDAATSMVVVGKDTRISGDMLAQAVCAGICSMGVNVMMADIMPTPGVAYLTASVKASAGIMVSASHNPYTDNGIKIFDSQGHKLSQDREKELEQMILDAPDAPDAPAADRDPGRVFHQQDLQDRYVDFLVGAIPPAEGLSLVIDCANGATYGVAARVFPGAHLMNAAPDGININRECGSEHPGPLAEAVLTHQADAGFAFDGDGDRVVAADETGTILSGDRLLALCANYMKEKGTLAQNTVVSTVMSNIGLTRALTEMDIAHVKTDVGDRHVLEKMLSSGAVIGGEDSGHMIFTDYQTTGDGILTALMICRVMHDTGKPLSELADCMTLYPQTLINVAVLEKPAIESIPAIQQAIAAAETALGEEGRVLVRYSGTQAMCRVMVEGPTHDVIQRHADTIASAIRKNIGDLRGEG